MINPITIACFIFTQPFISSNIDERLLSIVQITTGALEGALVMLGWPCTPCIFVSVRAKRPRLELPRVIYGVVSCFSYRVALDLMLHQRFICTFNVHLLRSSDD